MQCDDAGRSHSLACPAAVAAMAARALLVLEWRLLLLLKLLLLLLLLLRVAAEAVDNPVVLLPRGLLVVDPLQPSSAFSSCGCAPCCCRVSRRPHHAGSCAASAAPRLGRDQRREDRLGAHVKLAIGSLACSILTSSTLSTRLFHGRAISRQSSGHPPVSVARQSFAESSPFDLRITAKATQPMFALRVRASHPHATRRAPASDESAGPPTIKTFHELVRLQIPVWKSLRRLSLSTLSPLLG